MDQQEPSTAATQPCPIETKDQLFKSKHFCTYPVDHEGDHHCGCGHTWEVNA